MNIDEIITQLTVEEKISLTTGRGAWNTAEVDRLGVPSCAMSDGPCGLRAERGGVTPPAVCFPSPSRLSCSFDPDTAFDAAKAIAEYARAKGEDLLLAPGVNIKRSPLCGRNFEYFSEDPLVAGVMGAAYVNGVQSTGMGACLKRFAANSTEYGRLVSDSVIDERALREIYLEAFRRVVTEARPHAVMCAYNKLNGVYCSENKRLLTDILRGEWGYDGTTISDWGATHDRVEGIKAGLNLEMPQNRTDLVAKAWQSDNLDEHELDEAVRRVLQLAATHYDGERATVDLDKQHKLARKIAAETAVLVKNSCGLLPLNVNEKIALVGRLAQHSAYQGGGSACVNSTKVDTLYDAVTAKKIDCCYAEGYAEDGSTSDELIEKACTYAKNCDKVVVLLGSVSEAEGWDRTWTLPEGQLKLLDAVTAVNGNVIVVVSCGAPVDTSWRNSVKSIVIDYYGGQASGSALFDVLYGITPPQGRLAETWPNAMPPTLSDYGTDYHASYYRESIFVGYRYYTTVGTEVAFPFGFGLGYTDAEWSTPTLSTSKIGTTKGKTKIQLHLSNNGDYKCAEVVQVYATNLDSRDFNAKKNLIAFKKVVVNPGKSRDVAIEIKASDLAHFDTDKNAFVTNGGRYLLTVGSNVNDDRFCLQLTVDGVNNTVDRRAELPHYYDPIDPSMRQFAALYGKAFPQEHDGYNVSTAVGDLPQKGFGKMLYDRIVKPTDTPGGVKFKESLPLRQFFYGEPHCHLLDCYLDVLNTPRPTLKQRNNLLRMQKQIDKPAD